MTHVSRTGAGAGVGAGAGLWLGMGACAATDDSLLLQDRR
jgi:hypothetical protein